MNEHRDFKALHFKNDCKTIILERVHKNSKGALASWPLQGSGRPFLWSLLGILEVVLRICGTLLSHPWKKAQ